MRSRKIVVLFALLVAMELLAGFAVLVGSSLLDAISIQYGMFWVLLVVALGGTAVALLVMATGPGEPWNRLIIVAGAVVAAGGAAAAISRNLVTLLVSLFILLIAYWRGLVVTEEPPTHANVLSRFGFGLALLFLGLVWVVARGIEHQSSIWHMMAFIGIGYTITTLVALSIARLDHVREPGAGQAVLLAVVLQLGVIALIGLTALQIFSVDVAGALFRPTQPLWDGLGSVLFNFILLLANPIQGAIDHLRVHPHKPRPPNLDRLPPISGDVRKPRSHPPTSSPQVAIGAFIIGVLILVGIVVLIWRTIPRLPRREREHGYAEDRHALSLAEMWHAVRSWLRQLFKRGAETAVEVVRARSRRVFGAYPEDPVRRAYAQLLRRAASLGVPREPGTTPDEFRDRLSRRWPAGSGDFAGLTDAYVRRRYGELALDESQVTRVREQWHHVRVMMRAPRFDRSAALAAEGTSGTLLGSPPPHRRWHMPSLGAIFQLPEPSFGVEEHRFTRSVILGFISLVAPIVILVIVLVLLALFAGGGSHTPHGLAPPIDTVAAMLRPIIR